MKRAKTLQADELKLVLAYVASRPHAIRNRTIVQISFLSGMRAHEIAALRLGDVIDDAGRVRDEIIMSLEQTKGRRPRRVFINARLRKELTTYIKHQFVEIDAAAPLFCLQTLAGAVWTS